MLQETIQKIPNYSYMRVTSLQPACTCIVSHYDPCTLENVPKNKIFWIFPHRVIDNLTFGLPYAWKLSNSTLHFLLKGYILRYLDALEEENLWEKENYNGFVPHSYMLECASLYPIEQPLMFFQSLTFSCEFVFEMEDWSDGDPGGGLSFFVSTRWQQILSLVSLILSI